MTRTANSKNPIPAGDDYFDLVRRFPLRPIRSRAQYDQAVELLSELLIKSNDPGLSDGENDYTDMLSGMVRAYDEKYFPIGRKLTPLEALQAIMEQTGMNTADLGRLLGSGRGHASLILNGKRELSKANIRKLADHFKVSAALFI